MKRWIRLMLLCLLLGAVTTIAVAWSSALLLSLSDPPPNQAGSADSESPITRDRFSGWAMQVHDVFGSGPSPADFARDNRFDHYDAIRWTRRSAYRVKVIRISARTGLPPTPNWTTFEELIPDWGSDFLHVPELTAPVRVSLDDRAAWGDRAVDARGWPCLAMWGGVRPSFEGGGWLCDGAIPIDFKPPAASRHYASMRWLPLNPIWPGFIMNTLFYAAICFALFAGFSGGKRVIRRKRGRCPKCGYDLRKNLNTGCPECGWRRRAIS